jgi:excisionase family DNA binding protein
MADLLTTAEVAKLLKRHPQTLVQWRMWNKGPRFLVVDGRRIRYRKQDVERYLRANA